MLMYLLTRLIHIKETLKCALKIYLISYVRCISSILKRFYFSLEFLLFLTFAKLAVT